MTDATPSRSAKLFSLLGILVALPLVAQTGLAGPGVERLPAPAVPPSASLGSNGDSCNFIDFESFEDLQTVGTVTGSPAVTFTGGWTAAIDSDAGGSASSANEPSPETTVFIPIGESIGVINFDEGVQYVEVFYTASGASLPIVLTAYSGLDGSGEVVDTAQGNTVGVGNENECGDPTGQFCIWDSVSLSAPENNIRSIALSGAVANQFAFDNMTYCTFVPPDVPVTPAQGLLLLALLLGAGAWATLRRRHAAGA